LGGENLSFRRLDNQGGANLFLQRAQRHSLVFSVGYSVVIRFAAALTFSLRGTIHRVFSNRWSATVDDVQTSPYQMKKT
jgi:hypothetical protein